MTDEPPPPDATAAFEQALDRFATERFVLRLFVAGNAPRSRTAVENVRRICDEYLGDRCELEIIDIYRDPDAPAADHVIAAPTLIRSLPLPVRRVIGDMTEQSKVLVGLDLVLKPR